MEELLNLIAIGYLTFACLTAFILLAAVYDIPPTNEMSKGQMILISLFLSLLWPYTWKKLLF